KRAKALRYGAYSTESAATSSARKFIGELKQAGCEVYFFLPALIAFFDKRINYRNHRKIVRGRRLEGFFWAA
ncbi:hypothetical protein ABFY68_29700, partial [Paenibacillus validus]